MNATRRGRIVLEFLERKRWRATAIVAGTRYTGIYCDCEYESMQRSNDFLTVAWVNREIKNGRLVPA